MVIRVLVQPTCKWLLDIFYSAKILPSDDAPLAMVVSVLVDSSFFSASGSGSSLITLAFGSLTEDLEVDELNVVSSAGC